MGGGGQGEGRPGEKGAAGVREAGEEGAGSGRKREKLRNIAQNFAIEKNAKRWEPTNTGREPGLKGTGSRRFKPPYPPPPIHASNRKERGQHFHTWTIKLAQ